MAPLIAVAGALMAAPTGPLALPWGAQIDEAERRFGIPAPWIERVISAESAGHTLLGGRPIRSRVGAMGLMQLMPRTWTAMRDAEHLGSDPDDPHDNILAGTAYLRLMYDRFGYPGLFAAYNAGPARYGAALATGQRLPSETLSYLATVTRLPAAMPRSSKRAAMQSLFVVRHDRAEDPSAPALAPAAGFFVAGGELVPGQ